MKRCFAEPQLTSPRPTVAVIGAGFSGVLTALRLVGAPDGPCVRLVERRARFAQGAAYSTTSPQHLLNVRAANMSAFPETPKHFLHWLAGEGREVVDGAFVTRATFGEYLQALLRDAAACPGAAGRLMLEGDEADALQRDGDGWRVTLAMGRSFCADAVVLALGNLPPHAPAGMSADARASAAYVADPWAMDPATAPETGAALLLGTGLTMVDVALSLNAARPGLKMLALSRRGLGPRRHTLEREPPVALETPRGSPAHVLRQLRGIGDGANWRAVIDGVRPHVQAVWRSWSLEERRRFLRHARPWWDVHRHRLAPPVASAIDHLTGSGALCTAAGAVERITPEGVGEGRLRVEWRPRANGALRVTEVDLLVNCTGPNGDLTASGEPLVASLAGAGLIRADACGVGADVDDACRLVGCDGRVEPTLFAVGPLTRGAFWEVTAVPDIRVQAAACAGAVRAAVQTRQTCPA